MRRIRRDFAVTACVCMIAGMLAGCGNSDSTPKDPDEIITLRILENDTAKSKGYLDELLNAFNEAHKEEGIVAVDANMDEYSNLAENGPYGYGPDVIYQANDKLMAYASDKHILPISPEDYECAEYIPEQAWDAFRLQVDGESYTCGIPVNIQEPMLFYRADKMPENWETEWDDDGNGVADFFENWNDLYAYSKYLRDTDPSANKDSQYGFMASFNNLYLNGEFIFSYGGYVFGKNADGTLNTEDIGFGKGNAATGLMALRQMAGLMNEGCIDDTITSTRYEKVADGTYFCTVSTPDTYTLFVEKLALQYEDSGMSKEEAQAKAEENLKMVELPVRLPADGDLSRDSSELADGDWVESVVMGGVNGYGISSYTKYKDACVEFVNFATSYDMIKTRQEMLGIAPTRSDVSAESGDQTSELIFQSLSENRIYLMPSVKEVDQIWTPSQTLLGDVAKDSFRANSGETEKYKTVEDMQTALDGVSKNIYDAIYTLAD
ncbi:MAG: extracellular solute-binding protein [Lachnospiraceae bacterium]|nr:extracellular solute-binding protein [Lachnospiraceae bacterium]